MKKPEELETYVTLDIKVAQLPVNVLRARARVFDAGLFL